VIITSPKRACAQGGKPWAARIASVLMAGNAMTVDRPTDPGKSPQLMTDLAPDGAGSQANRGIHGQRRGHAPSPESAWTP
jgi:hypothetical protein